MTWVEVALFMAAVLGLVAGGILVARSPTFWVGMGAAMLKAAAPYIVKFVTKPMTPEQEAEFRQTTRRAQEWDAARKKPRDR